MNTCNQPFGHPLQEDISENHEEICYGLTFSRLIGFDIKPFRAVSNPLEKNLIKGREFSWIQKMYLVKAHILF